MTANRWFLYIFRIGKRALSGAFRKTAKGPSFVLFTCKPKGPKRGCFTKRTQGVEKWSIGKQLRFSKIQPKFLSVIFT